MRQKELSHIDMPKWLLRVAFFLIIACNTPSNASAIDKETLTNTLDLHCYECHGPNKQKANLRLDNLTGALDTPQQINTWINIHDHITDGVMPPEDLSTQDKLELRNLAKHLANTLHTTDAKRQATRGRTSLRQLNPTEYEYTLRDILNLPSLDIKEMLPPSASAHGFDNVAEAQNVSYIQMARYLQAAQVAIDTAMSLGPKPPRTSEHLPFQLQSRFYKRNRETGVIGERGEIRHVDEWAVFVRQSNSAQAPWRIGNKQPTMSGHYRFRLRAQGVFYDNGKLLPQDRNHVGSLYTRERRRLHTFDIPKNPAIIEFTAWLHEGDKVDFFGATLDDRNTPGAGDVKPNYAGPGIAVEYIEIEGPLEEDWPRLSHQRLFGTLPVIPWTPESGLREPAPLTHLRSRDPKRPFKPGSQNKRPKWIVHSDTPHTDAERLLRQFLNRAYRAPVDEEEVQRCLAFAHQAIDKKWCFQDAMREAYKAALCSPDFLFLHEPVGPLSNHALATRLAYFLWRSAPDSILQETAAAENLTHSQTLRLQTERMLNDPRAKRFIDDFTGQWLDLRNINATAPDRYLYPEYFCDNHLVESSVAESQAFFAEMIRTNQPANSIIASDFLTLNERLAKLYNIPGVQGCAIRKIPIPQNSTRGGFLTQSSVLKVTANGLTTSPVVRGAWMLDRLFGDPPPPPPPNAGSIDPDTRGATTVRQLLEKHRRDPACNSCHQKIDPPGFALEGFDVMGATRGNYRSFEHGEEVSIRVADREVRYKIGPTVDASGQTPEGHPFRNINAFRKIMLNSNQRQLARNITERLMTFATGAGISFADRTTINNILDQTEDANFGLRSIIHQIIQSPTFRHK